MRDWQVFVRAHLSVPDLTPEREARVVRELATQLEDFYRDARGRGLSDADADGFAAGQIKDWTTLADEVRQADRRHRRTALDRLTTTLEDRPSGRRGRMLGQALRDARYGLRQLRNAPGFTFVALLTLALGIGATTCIFTVVNGVLLKPLPYPDGDRLVRIHEIVPQFGQFSVAPANFLDWRKQSTSFDRVAAYGSSSVTYIGPDGPERLPSMIASWDLFPALRVKPALGNVFTESDDNPAAPRVTVLSYKLWQRRFNGDPAIIGKAITLNGVPTTVVGVMPADFYFPTRTPELWVPIALDPATATRGGHFLGVVARLKDGVSFDRASTEMKALAERLAAEYPQNSANESARVVRLQDQIVGAIRPALLTLFAAVGVVILIVCANVANLLLARASAREREIAVRTALGAGRARIVVQMLAESVVLASLGGGLGVLLAWAGMTPLVTLAAGSIPRAQDITIDLGVLGFALAASIGTGLIFGLAPAWQASRPVLAATLKDSGRSSTTSRGRWLRRSLLVAEVALSIVLLTGATLLLRSFGRLTSVDPGFKADRVLAFQVSLPATAYKDDAKKTGFFSAVIEGLEAQAGVEAVGVTQTIPMRGSYTLAFNIRGRAPAKDGEGPSANYRVASPRYFDAIGVPLVAGRALTTHDTATSEPVALVDQAFARKFFPGENPIGQGVHIGNGGPADQFLTVVGVVGNIHYDGLDVSADPTMYVPFGQDPFSTLWVVAKARGDAESLVPAARQVIRQLDANLPLASLGPLSTIVNDSVAPRRFSTLLLTMFAGLAVFLAAVGLYGLVAYSVSQRTREIGLRMALGAAPANVLRMVVGDGLRLTVVGIVAGVGGALMLARFIQTLLFEIPPSDPLSYVVTASVLLGVAALACYVPARRAMRVDPVLALQGD